MHILGVNFQLNNCATMDQSYSPAKLLDNIIFSTYRPLYCLEYPEKRYKNVTNYYYYWSLFKLLYL